MNYIFETILTSCVRYALWRVASVSGDKTCRIWSTKTGILAQILVGHSGGLCDFTWSSDDKIIATASDDTFLMLWDSLTGKCIRLLAGHECSVTCCAFNLPSSNVLASGSSDETLRLWDIKNGKCMLKTRSTPYSAYSSHVRIIARQHRSELNIQARKLLCL